MSSNDYMNEYMKKRWELRRKIAIGFLGGFCVDCGSTNDLEFDHVNPATKSFTIAQASSFSEERFWNEVEKCQLLCKKCHVLKTITESGKTVAKGTHGTISSYRYCRCDSCRAAKREHNKKYRLKRQAKIIPLK